ncbi:hypothetical protein MRB53_018898 [Persea americana]|uniref:Uncharacterized protein n=1 Tax=Persea americana TaxID=3435 RepID=A0ACC2M917_PERAE|nr:hypothetical protein MRB53_018898 [Persea americana]
MGSCVCRLCLLNFVGFISSLWPEILQPLHKAGSLRFFNGIRGVRLRSLHGAISLFELWLSKRGIDRTDSCRHFSSWN